MNYHGPLTRHEALDSRNWLFYMYITYKSMQWIKVYPGKSTKYSYCIIDFCFSRAANFENKLLFRWSLMHSLIVKAHLILCKFNVLNIVCNSSSLDSDRFSESKYTKYSYFLKTKSKVCTIDSSRRLLFVFPAPRSGYLYIIYQWRILGGFWPPGQEGPFWTNTQNRLLDRF